MNNNGTQTAKDNIINIFTWVLNMLNIFKQSAINKDVTNTLCFNDRECKIMCATY